MDQRVFGLVGAFYFDEYEHGDEVFEVAVDSVDAGKSTIVYHTLEDMLFVMLEALANRRVDLFVEVAVEIPCGDKVGTDAHCCPAEAKWVSCEGLEGSLCQSDDRNTHMSGVSSRTNPSFLYFRRRCMMAKMGCITCAIKCGSV